MASVAKSGLAKSQVLSIISEHKSKKEEEVDFKKTIVDSLKGMLSSFMVPSVPQGGLGKIQPVTVAVTTADMDSNVIAEQRATALMGKFSLMGIKFDVRHAKVSFKPG